MSIYEQPSNIFRKNIVFGTVPIGDPGDASLNLIHHLNNADIILVETHSQFSRLVSGIRAFVIKHNFGVILEPRAVIYQYNLMDGFDKINHVNQLILDEAVYNNKKVIVVSDEGYSNFMDPGDFLKEEIIKRGLEFQTLPGPSAIISTVAHSHGLIGEFFFSCDPSVIVPENKITYFTKIKNMNVPTVFTLNPTTARTSFEELKSVFGNDFYVDFSMNLTRPNEEHVRGSFDDAIKYIDSNYDRFHRDTEDDRYTVILFPTEYKQQSIEFDYHKGRDN